MFGGHHPELNGMGGYPPPFLGGRGLMGGYPGQGMPMDMGMGVGGGLGMGMHPALGMGFGMGMGRRQPFGPAPYAHARHPPFSYGSPGPPRAHSFRSPFSRSRHSPFSRMFGGAEDDFDDEYRMPSRHGLGRGNRGAFRLARPRGRGNYRPGSYFEDSDDEFDEYDDYEDDWDDGDEYEEYYGSGRRSRQPRWW